jgi:hypothetical protein
MNRNAKITSRKKAGRAFLAKKSSSFLEKSVFDLKQKLKTQLKNEAATANIKIGATTNKKQPAQTFYEKISKKVRPLNNSMQKKPMLSSEPIRKRLTNFQHILHESDITKFASIAFLAHFLSSSFLGLTVKHIYYISFIGFFHVEFFLIAIYGLLNSCLLFCSLMSYFKREEDNSSKRKIEPFLNYYLCGSFVAYLVIGSTQLVNGMSFWEHKYFLNDFFECELAKFLAESALFSLFLVFKARIE